MWLTVLNKLRTAPDGWNCSQQQLQSKNKNKDKLSKVAKILTNIKERKKKDSTFDFMIWVMEYFCGF